MVGEDFNSDSAINSLIYFSTAGLIDPSLKRLSNTLIQSVLDNTSALRDETADADATFSGAYEDDESIS